MTVCLPEWLVGLLVVSATGAMAYRRLLKAQSDSSE
jgi:hypothetical protein